jgi:hypothetical protein
MFTFTQEQRRDLAMRMWAAHGRFLGMRPRWPAPDPVGLPPYTISHYDTPCGPATVARFEEPVQLCAGKVGRLVGVGQTAALGYPVLEFARDTA